MTGSLDMGANAITNLADPTQDGDGVNRGYLVRYADSRILQATVQLTAAGWSAAAPYTQTVALPGILPTDRPHYGVVYSGNWEAEKEAFHQRVHDAYDALVEREGERFMFVDASGTMEETQQNACAAVDEVLARI